MKGILFLILLLSQISLVNSQVTNLGITKRFEGSGKIDNYDINFILDVITRPHYVDGDHVGEIQQFSGKYYYKEYEKDIFLSGTRLILFTQGLPTMDDSIKLFEFDKNYNKTAVFTGVLSKTSFVGNWVSVRNSKQLSFKVLFDQRKFTLLEVITSKGLTILPFNSLGIYNQSEFEILKVIEKSQKTYVLATLAFTTCGALKVRGSGCGGHEVYFRLYEIQKNSVEYSEVKLGGYSESYTQNINNNECAFKVSQFVNNTEIIKIYKVKFNNIEDGITEIKL